METANTAWFGDRSDHKAIEENLTFSPKFDENGYLSSINIENLREKLKKYKIIEFDFGTFGNFNIHYNWYIRLSLYANKYYAKN